MIKNDTGIITAFRDQYNINQNKQRNKSLKAKLSDKGFGLIKVGNKPFTFNEKTH